MEKPRTADIISFALSNQDTAITSIIDASKSFDGTDEDRTYSLVASGFALGMQYVFNEARDDSLGFPLHAVSDTEFLRNTLARLNDWQMTDPDVDHKMLESVRAPIADFLAKQTEARRAIMISRFHEASGVPVATIMGKGDIREEEATTAAVSVIQTNSSIYGGFIMYFGDIERVPDQRPYGFSEAYLSSYVPPEAMRAQLRRRYESQYQALVAFGRWFVEDMRKTLARIEFGAENQGQTNSEDAQSEAAKLFSRMSQSRG